jgi:purine-binding chemotaxis protein CheW
LNDRLQFVGFRIGQQAYALPIAAVREIVRPPEITAVPQSADEVAGVMNLRGRIVPVVDLRKRFAQALDKSPKNRVLVMSFGAKLVGVLVDAASEVLKIEAAEIEPAPKLLGDEQESYVAGIAKYNGKLVVLLDPKKQLPQAERSELASV